MATQLLIQQFIKLMLKKNQSLEGIHWSPVDSLSEGQVEKKSKIS